MSLRAFFSAAVGIVPAANSWPVAALVLSAAIANTSYAQSVYSTPYYFLTLAGSGVAGANDGVGSAASISARTEPAVDAAGNVYLADMNNNTIRKITPGGVVTTLAGLAGAAGSLDGTGSAARFRGPRAVAVDSAGNLYVADQINNTIRKITPAAVVTTLAGQAGTTGSTDGTGAAARFNSPHGLTVDANGNVYVADSGNSVIRKITAAGVVTTFAGQANIYGSTDGLGGAASFNGPGAIASDGAGNLYVADFGNFTIRKITPAGLVTTLAGLAKQMGSTDGTGSAARMTFPTAITVDGSGNVFFADVLNHTLRKITPAGVVTTIAGLAGVPGDAEGLGSGARFNSPYGLAADSRGNLYLSDEKNFKIRRSVFPPAITLQPIPQTVNAGGTAVFTVITSSEFPANLQWHKDGAAIPGATGPVLTLNNVQVAAAGTYTLVATNVAGATTSSPATLIVNVTVAGEPVTQTVTVGSPVQFRYNGATPAGTTFQWRKEGVAIAGATNANFAINSAALTDAGNYTVVVIAGAVSTTSNTATLVVLPATAPTFSAHPASQTITAGAPVQFSVSVTSSTPVTYQWRKNGTTINGATNATFGISAALAGDTGSYTVAATNAGGVTISNAATLIVNVLAASPPVISSSPQDDTVVAGEAVVLSVSVSGTQPLSLQWYKNGSPIAGATQVIFAIPNAQPADAGNYNVVASNSAGSVTSDAAVVRVTTLPAILEHPASRSATEGTTMELLVSAQGTPPLSYQWRKVGTAIAGATGSILAFNPVKLADAGSYTVSVTNSAGSVTSSAAEVTVTPAGPTAWLSNVSIRTNMAAGQVVIVGLAVEGGSREILVRAAGPALAAFGVPAPMVDPRIELYRGTTLVTSNEDWLASLAPTFASTGAFGWTTGSRDAAFRQNLDGPFSIHARGTGPGVVLVEAYDLGSGNTPRLINVSARNRVGTGDDVLIAGFNITGSGTKRLLIRGVGPGLAAFQVPGTLLDPKIELYDSDGTKLAENDDWAVGLAPNFGLVGAFPLPPNSRDAVLLTNLAVGSYSVLVRGADGGGGDAIVEIYELP